MARIITALFDNRAAAERARKALRALGVPANHIVLHEEAQHRTTPATGGAIGGEPGLPSLLDAFFLPSDDYAAHQEAMRRGGVVVSARVRASEAAAARRALAEAGAEDLDAKERRWRAAGWSPAAVAGAAKVAPSPGMPGTATTVTGAAKPEAPPGETEAGAVLRREPGGPARSYVIETPAAEEPDSPVKPGSGPGPGGGSDRGTS
jgi:hypothetical protein